jgi:uncharacterized protein GlcG (DUF336 family)
MGMTLEQAQKAVQAAKEKAQELNLKMNIAVVDAGANLTAFARMDGAWLGSIDIAIRKARTACFFDMPTGDLGQASQPGGPLYNIEHSNGGLITFPGGIPIRDGNEEVIGAIGVSGSTVENDHAVAEAGVKAILKCLEEGCFYFFIRLSKQTSNLTLSPPELEFGCNENGSLPVTAVLRARPVRKIRNTSSKVTRQTL